jgi:hypothetical protein
MENIFQESVVKEISNRIDKLNTSTKPLWGTMSVSQMLAHCNVTYELVYEDKHPKPNFLIKLLLKLFVKNAVVSEKPFGHSEKTAPQFLVKNDKNFEEEKIRLKNYIKKTQELGEDYFDQKESHSFGVLSKQEWNNMFYKHINHHLSQFGV